MSILFNYKIFLIFFKPEGGAEYIKNISQKNQG
jgi:hypothetical protein